MSKGPLHLARMAHVRTVLRTDPAGLALDAQTYEEYAVLGWTRAELQHAVAALVEAGEALVCNEAGRLIVTPTEGGG